ncbi:MAG: hypothetical protein K1X50_02980 [Candidatus Promineofilum sp.]|nr:hypothetical protein [Promineifilum sp.]MCW5864765.1 hypothetical protein [Anaerolineae bacterium]
MYPEDRVLVAYVPRPSDFELIRREGWYRIPQRSAPKGLHAEVIAFYFGRAFEEQKYAIHYYARNAGHELARRRDLLPDEPNHPRADDIYYKVQLGPLQQLAQPIVSLRWRRLTFIHTTWDRFQEATEINDLFIEGGLYVDRLYATLKERGIPAERDYRVAETQPEYVVALSVPTRAGRVEVAYGDLPDSEGEVAALADALVQVIARQGGIVLPGNDAEDDRPQTPDW